MIFVLADRFCRSGRPLHRAAQGGSWTDDFIAHLAGCNRCKEVLTHADLTCRICKAHAGLHREVRLVSVHPTELEHAACRERRGPDA